MKKILLFAAALSVSGAFAQTGLLNYQMGDPGDANYDYLKELAPLKNYIDYGKYPNFKLGIGTTVNDYLTNATVKGLTNDNFTETVAGNAMKMASCVDNNGNMNFTRVTQYVNAAEQAGINVYGHTLAWHAQQPNGWLRGLIKDKPPVPFENPDTMVNVVVASKDFRVQQNVGWSGDQAQFGFSLNFSATNGLNIHTTKKVNSWEVQFVAYSDIPVGAGKTYDLVYEIKGSKDGTMHSKLGDWSNGSNTNFQFTTDWEEVRVKYTCPVNNPFLLLQCGDFVGDIWIRNIKVEEKIGAMKDGDQLILPQATPLTREEKCEVLSGAMEQWIRGMMNACGGKVKAWDVVNEAISGGGNDGSGNYTLQHSQGYNGDATWDVGGDAFYWQDHMGDLEYVRTAVRYARQYGPEDIKLFINDYNLESDWDDNKKLKSLINWIAKWEADGETYVDGIGTQMHISYYENSGIQASKKRAITKMFQLMAASGKLVRVSEFDMGYVNASGKDVATGDMTEAQHHNMADYYEWIIKEYLRLVPAEQQWGICFWCPTDAPTFGGWRANTPVGLWTYGTFYRKHAYAGVVEGLGGVDYSDVQAVEAESAKVTGIYNITGYKYPAGTCLESLPAGVYIVDGKLIRK